VSYFDIIDNNKNGLINRFSNDRIDGSDIRASYVGDTVTVQLSDGSTTTITGATFYLADGRQVFTPVDGSLLSTATLVSTSWVGGQSSVTPAQLGPPCYTRGTLVETKDGPRKVEDLKPGDLVMTADRGLAPVVMIHTRHLSPEHLREKPRHGPVLIYAGALGCGLPERDLLVSPQHRILVRSVVAERMFNEGEILVSACQLAGQPGIRRLDVEGGVDYVHVLLDHHAILFAEGAPAESLFLGEQVHETLNIREIDWIRSHLPQGDQHTMEPARPFVRGRRLKQFLRRIDANAKPLLEPTESAHQTDKRPRLVVVA
jgi:hypothetical protein